MCDGIIKRYTQANYKYMKDYDVTQKYHLSDTVNEKVFILNKLL